MRAPKLWLVCWALGLLAAVPALASRPAPHQGQGCVVEGRVYAVQGQVPTVYPYSLPEGMDLRPYEGRKVLLQGWLSPGDRFVPQHANFTVLGPCDAAWLEAIRRWREARP